MLNEINSNNIDKLKDNDLNLPKISVIIPVYNMEKYLNECLDSVINQTLKDIEIICINDGSTDNSLKILKEYEKKDKRIKILTQKNSGVAIARNRGIDFSKGEFIGFLDSDDMYMNKSSLENLYYSAVNNNVLISGGNSNKYYNDKLIEKLEPFEKEGIIKYSDFQKQYYFWKYIYSSKLIKENKLYFPNYSNFEDPVFFVKIMNLAEIFYALPQTVHYYRIRHKSSKLNKNNVIDMLKGMLDILKFSDKNNLNILYYDLIEKFNHPYRVKHIKQFFKTKEVKNKTIEILKYINYKKVKSINKKFKLNTFYKKIMKKRNKIKKKSDL